MLDWSDAIEFAVNILKFLIGFGTIVALFKMANYEFQPEIQKFKKFLIEVLKVEKTLKESGETLNETKTKVFKRLER